VTATASLRFRQWAAVGAVQRGLDLPPGAPSTEAAYDAFLRGWNDRLAGRSDFVRRSYVNDHERLAYMAGRFLAKGD
jgi:hypothetical protein